MFSLDHIPLQKIQDTFLDEKSVELSVLRLDQIHPQMGGNKFFKLKYNLQAARASGLNTLLTFGGAYSNHIYATAAAGKYLGFRTIGLIRGEETLPLNTTLQFAQKSGMQLHYVNRESYRGKNNPDFIYGLQVLFGDFYLIPEGGSNAAAVKGCSEISTHIPIDWDYICTPCGTGGTLAGLVLSLKSHQKALGFAVLKGGDFLNREVELLLENFNFKHWEEKGHIFTEYHFGGYARKKTELIDFMDQFENQHQIRLEWIYSGKMFYGIYDLIRKDYFKPGSRIVALHTGGVREVN